MRGLSHKIKEGDQVEFVVLTPGGQKPAQLVEMRVDEVSDGQDLIKGSNVLRLLDGTAKSHFEAYRSYKISRIIGGTLKKVIK